MTGNSGPVFPNSGSVGVAPPFPAPAAAANVAQTAPSAPTFNFSNGETSTENLLSAFTAAREDGTPWNVIYGTADPPSPPGFNVSQTTPSAPTGTFAQSGSALIAATSASASGVGLAGQRGMDVVFYPLVK